MERPPVGFFVTSSSEASVTWIYWVCSDSRMSLSGPCNIRASGAWFVDIHRFFDGRLTPKDHTCVATSSVTTDTESMQTETFPVGRSRTP